jgi:hypothetical protein
VELFAAARREGLPLAAIDALKAVHKAPALAVTLLAECESVEERSAVLDLQRHLPLLWAGVMVKDWIAAFGGRLSGGQARLVEIGVDPSIAIRHTIAALTDIASLRPELLGHARMVYLMSIAPQAVAAKTSYDFVALQRSSGRSAKTEIGALVARHADTGLRGPHFLNPALCGTQMRRWQEFDPQWADVIAAPFAIADHAYGIATLSFADIRACREGWLFDPEFFEAIVPIALAEAMGKAATIAGRVK